MVVFIIFKNLHFVPFHYATACLSNGSINVPPLILLQGRKKERKKKQKDFFMFLDDQI